MRRQVQPLKLLVELQLERLIKHRSQGWQTKQTLAYQFQIVLLQCNDRLLPICKHPGLDQQPLQFQGMPQSQALADLDRQKAQDVFTQYRGRQALLQCRAQGRGVGEFFQPRHR